MGQSIILAAPNIRVYINGKVYKEMQSITFSVDYGESEIYGIDSPWAQEIALTKVTIRGSVRGLRIKNSGGLQAKSMRPLFSDIAASPYLSIRVNDLTTGEDILLLQTAKVTRESHTIETKRIYHMDFDFIAQIPLFSLDRV